MLASSVQAVVAGNATVLRVCTLVPFISWQAHLRRTLIKELDAVIVFFSRRGVAFPHLGHIFSMDCKGIMR